MEKFNFDLDTKITCWKRTSFEIEAKTLEEAKIMAIQFYKDGNTEEISWSDIENSDEIMDVSENGNNPTNELAINGEIIFTNLND